MFDLILYLKAIFLGIVEGLTEFIPVSSTAHLVIFSQIIDFQSIQNNIFEIAIQIGAICAIIFIYFNKITDVLLNIKQEDNRSFLINIILAFIPAIIIGLLAHDFIKNFLFSNLVIACSLIIGGLIIIIIEKSNNDLSFKQIENINKNTAFKIGLLQCLAMIPGVSRSGATIIGAIFLGVNRKLATEFSFFLAIPTIASACLYDIYKNFEYLTINDFELILTGIVSSFISSFLVIRWLIKFVSNHNFIIFGYYRIGVGLLILLFTFAL